jgi:ribosomal protein S1
MLLSGSIKSIEDNGYIIDFSIDKCTGFLPKKDADKYLAKRRKNEQKRLYVGQPLDFCVASVGRVITVTLSREAMQEPIDPDSEDFNVRSLRCGMLVKGSIESVVTQGLFVELFDVLKCSLHRNDLDSPEIDPPTEYDQGQMITAR